MNGMAYGIGGFVRGLAGGAEISMRWQDRKRRQKLEDEDRALDKQDRALRLEDRARRIKREDEADARTREADSRTRADWAYAQAEREREAQLRQSMARGVEGAQAQAQANRDANAVSRSQVAEPGAPVQPAPPAAEPAPIARRISRSSGGAVAAPEAPAATAGGVVVPPEPDASAAQRQPYGVSRAGRARVYTNPPEAAPQPGMALPPVDTGGPALRQPPPGPGTVPSDPAAAALPAVPAPVPPDNAPVPASAQVAASAARGSASRTASPKEASEDFMTIFTQEFAPQIEQDFIAAGNLEGLKVFKTWMDDETTKQGVRDFGSMIRSAAMGDEEGFLDNAAKLYNSPYYDDGMTMVREKSGVTKAEDGSTTGAYVTFRDDRTGEETRMDFESMDDLMKFGAYALSPEEVWKHGLEQVAADAEAQKEALKHQRAIELEREKAKIKEANSGKPMEEQIADEVNALREAALTSGEQLSEADLIQQAVKNIQARQAAAASFGAPQRGAVAARVE